jgi:pimeloyl-ACP methyl ester carboxylesterase
MIAYTCWRRPARELVVIAPGFWRVRLAWENLFLANHLLRRGYDVAVLDFRGHGDSGGRYGFGASESSDLLAVIGELVGDGKSYSRFAVIGLSMGGTIAAVALARRPLLPCRGLAMISSPADFQALRPRPWKSGALRQVRLRHVVRMPRLSARGLFAAKPAAAAAVARLAIPKLIVTAEGDWLVDPSREDPRTGRGAAGRLRASEPARFAPRGRPRQVCSLGAAAVARSLVRAQRAAVMRQP